MKPTDLSTDLDSRLILQGIHVELTEAMKNAIREKFGRLLARDNRIIRLNVRLHRDQTIGTEHHYVLTCQAEISGPDLIATVDGKEPYDLFDAAVEKLDHVIERRHGRRKDKRNHPEAIELDASLPKAPQEA